MVHTTRETRRGRAEVQASEPAATPVARAAEEVFELTKLSWLLRTRRRRKDTSDLTETEFLTLDMVAHFESQTVGQLRKHIGVLPAQMSRILRSLERRGDKPLIRCTINPTDRRRIDVTITEAGRKAYRAFRDARVSMGAEILAQLPPEEVREFMQIMEKFRGLLLPQLQREAAGQ
jgi:DNA-binding MarR family transcriptional regulator